MKENFECCICGNLCDVNNSSLGAYKILVCSKDCMDTYIEKAKRVSIVKSTIVNKNNETVEMGLVDMSSNSTVTDVDVPPTLFKNPFGKKKK